MLLRRLDHDVTLHLVRAAEDIALWRPGFIAAYLKIFEEPPYLEDYTEAEAGAVWDYLTRCREHVTLVAAQGDQVVGFGIAIPLAQTRKVAAALAGLVPDKHTFYLAEMGILPAWRGLGLGRVLIRERIKHMDSDRYSHVVLRVPLEGGSSGELYRALGFEDMGVYMDVENRRTDGAVRTDRRMFMSRVLSQVDVE